MTQQNDMGRMMAEALRAGMPSLKTQAQFTAFMICFDAFRLMMDATFSGDPVREAACRDAFEKSLSAAKNVTEISKKMEEIPQEHRTKASEAFVSPPNEFQEYDVQKKLLLELQAIDNFDRLNEWYQQTKGERDKVVSTSLRNALIDAIRGKRLELEPKPAPDAKKED